MKKSALILLAGILLTGATGCCGTGCGWKALLWPGMHRHCRDGAGCSSCMNGQGGMVEGEYTEQYAGGAVGGGLAGGHAGCASCRARHQGIKAMRGSEAMGSQGPEGPAGPPTGAVAYPYYT